MEALAQNRIRNIATRNAYIEAIRKAICVMFTLPLSLSSSSEFPSEDGRMSPSHKISFLPQRNMWSLDGCAMQRFSGEQECSNDHQTIQMNSRTLSQPPHIYRYPRFATQSPHRTATYQTNNASYIHSLTLE